MIKKPHHHPDVRKSPTLSRRRRLASPGRFDLTRGVRGPSMLRPRASQWRGGLGHRPSSGAFQRALHARGPLDPHTVLKVHPGATKDEIREGLWPLAGFVRFPLVARLKPAVFCCTTSVPGASQGAPSRPQPWRRKRQTPFSGDYGSSRNPHAAVRRHERRWSRWRTVSIAAVVSTQTTPSAAKLAIR